jgi:hypothetical protein
MIPHKVQTMRGPNAGTGPAGFVWQYALGWMAATASTHWDRWTARSRNLLASSMSARPEFQGPSQKLPSPRRSMARRSSSERTQSIPQRQLAADANECLESAETIEKVFSVHRVPASSDIYYGCEGGRERLANTELRRFCFVPRVMRYLSYSIDPK